MQPTEPFSEPQSDLVAKENAKKGHGRLGVDAYAGAETISENLISGNL